LIDNVTAMIVNVISKYEIEKIVLFGSRARGDHSLVSDYDIAVFEHRLTPLDRAQIKDKIDDLPTLKKIQIVYVNRTGTEELLQNIRKEGKVLYERNRK
jgi:predicted nucleotidyltransferase